jgi:hypothetical protein
MHDILAALAQMGASLDFHIAFPCIGAAVGVAIGLVIMISEWLRPESAAYCEARVWSSAVRDRMNMPRRGRIDPCPLNRS